MEPLQPELAGYEFIELIARRDNASVWKARQQSLDRLVAIKLFPRKTDHDGDAPDFRNEAMAAAKLKCPNIVQVIDAGKTPQFSYIVMEYVPGKNLLKRLNEEGPMPEAKTAAIARQVAAALQYAWTESGLIHCDIKPENILLTDAGDVRVGDLGIARSMNARAHPESDFIGTPNYASPEQIKGIQLDCRSDIYSLGAMLYHLVTGEAPFAVYEPKDILDMQLNGQLEDPRRLRPGLSDAITAVIRQMLARDPGERYRSWDDVCADLDALLTRAPLPFCAEAVPSTLLNLESPIKLPVPPKTKTAGGMRTKPSKNAASSAPTGEKKQITVKKEALPVSPTLKQPKKSGTVGCIVFLALLAASLFAAIRFTPLGERVRPWIEQARDFIMQDHNTALLPTEEYETPDTQVPASSASSDTATPGDKATPKSNWQQDPDWINGQRLYEEARNLFDMALQKRSRADLAAAEEKGRAAIAAFTAARPRLPPAANVQLLIDQCHHLITDCRNPAGMQPAAQEVTPENRPPQEPGTPPSVNQAVQPTPRPTATPRPVFPPPPPTATPRPVFPPPPPSRTPTAAPSAPEEPFAADSTGAEWQRNPDFVRGQQLYREARQLYASYLSNRKQETLVLQAEEKSRAALEAFTAAKDRLPKEANISQIITQCNKLIFDCHQARQLKLK